MQVQRSTGEPFLCRKGTLGIVEMSKNPLKVHVVQNVKASETIRCFCRTCLNIFLFSFQIRELNLDNCRATMIEGLTADFKNLESLSLINVGLTTLKGLPSLPSLKKVRA